MILLVDTNPGRARKALANAPSMILHWSQQAWRDLNEDAKTPDAEGSWFLLHDNNTEIFLEIVAKQEKGLKELPVIRFTGGDSAGRPDTEAWVRYRAISEATPFETDELKALDAWVRGGCDVENRPWLLIEDKPHFLRGLLILLQLARELGPPTASGGSNRRCAVETSQWWRDRLDKEEDWANHIRIEYKRRKFVVSQQLEEFIYWVEKRSECGFVEPDQKEPRLLFELFRPAEDQEYSRIEKLIDIVEGAL